MKKVEKLEAHFPEVIEGIPAGEILRAVASIQFGSVLIIIQDSKVVQIDRTEKKRVVFKSEGDYQI